MAIWVSDPALAEYDVGEGENPALPPMCPPPPEDYTDYSRSWQIEMERNIGAHPWIQFIVKDNAGNEIDITNCVADGGVNGFRMEAPFRDLDRQGYQVADWQVQLRRTHVDELLAMLTFEGESWRGRTVWAYLCLARAQDRLPMYRWQIDDITRTDPPMMVLLDMRRDMLRGPLYADGMDVPGATSWLDTVEQTDAGGGTPTAFMPQYVEIITRCEIGTVDIEFTSATEFTISGSGFEGTGNINETFYTHEDQKPNSQFRILPEAWDAGVWEEGDTVSWTFTFSFRQFRDAAGYIRIPHAMYRLARGGGYAQTDFDASADFPGIGTFGLSGWQLCGYPCITTATGWTDLHGPATAMDTTWDYAEWMGLRSYYVMIAFSQPCTILEAIAEVGKGVAYIMPGKGGKLELRVPADFTGEAVTLSRQTGLMRCHIRHEKPGGYMRGIHEYSHTANKWMRVLLYPEDRSEAYYGYRPPEGTQETRFLGYPRILEGTLSAILGDWHMIHKDGAPILHARMGLMGMHYAPGHRVLVTSTEAAITDELVMVDAVEYDFTTWTASVEGVDWSALGIEPLIWQADDSLDEDHIFDGDKVFT